LLPSDGCNLLFQGTHLWIVRGARRRRTANAATQYSQGNSQKQNLHRKVTNVIQMICMMAKAAKHILSIDREVWSIHSINTATLNATASMLFYEKKQLMF